MKLRERTFAVRGLTWLLLVLCWSCVAADHQIGRADPRSVEAAFLRNFARYVTWPAKAFASAGTAWRVCVVGPDPFGDILDRTLAGRTEQGRPFRVIRTANGSQLRGCHIVYVAYEVDANRRAVLAELKDRPVLTVSNAGDFLQEGGIIRFNVTNYVEMSVNLDAARAASLSIQTKMLEVAYGVMENGELHAAR